MYKGHTPTGCGASVAPTQSVERSDLDEAQAANTGK